MNKSKILSILFSVFPVVVWAQKGTLNYKLIQDTPFGKNEINYITYFNTMGSIEFGIPKYKINSTETISQTETKGEYKMVVVSNKKLFIFKNLAENKLTLADELSRKRYLISDTLNSLKWRITKEHQKIQDYSCTKAILNFRGRNYTVWFAESIPLSLGPWKFGGLPGLIIKISDSENKFVYELTGIDLKAKFDDGLLNVPQAYQMDKPITHQEFMNVYNEKIEHYKKMSRVVTTGANGSYGTATVILAEKQEKF